MIVRRDCEEGSTLSHFFLKFRSLFSDSRNMEGEDEAIDVGDSEEIPLNHLLTPEARNAPSGTQERSVIRIRNLVFKG